MDLFMNSAVCLLERAAEKFKDKTVFEDKDGSITFKGLREKSRALATALLGKVQTGNKSPIVVLLPKSVNSIVSFMGILYTSSPYVPVEYEIAPVRMETIAKNLRPRR